NVATQHSLYLQCVRMPVRCRPRHHLFSSQYPAPSARVQKSGVNRGFFCLPVRWLLDLAYPLIGARPIADLTAMDLLEVLRTVEVRGRYETANRLRSTFGTIFR